MVSICRYIRAFGIALLAIAGSLSAPGLAPAEMTRDGAKAGRDCCASRPMTDCGCCVAPEPASAPIGPMRLAPAHATSLERSPRPCECRASVPNAPASKSERPASERRAGSERGGLPGLLVVLNPPAAPPAAPRVLPGSSSAEAPLYRLTARFLC